MSLDIASLITLVSLCKHTQFCPNSFAPTNQYKQPFAIVIHSLGLVVISPRTNTWEQTLWCSCLDSRHNSDLLLFSVGLDSPLDTQIVFWHTMTTRWDEVSTREKTDSEAKRHQRQNKWPHVCLSTQLDKHINKQKHWPTVDKYLFMASQNFQIKCRSLLLLSVHCIYKSERTIWQPLKLTPWKVIFFH